MIDYNSHLKLLAITFCMCILYSCDSDTSDTDFLLGCWTHSFEEDDSGKLIYRPCDYTEFPVSHYRNSFFLKYSDKCDYLMLAANDGHFFTPANWNFDAKSKLLTIQKDDNILNIFEVLDHDEDRLRLKRIE